MPEPSGYASTWERRRQRNVTAKFVADSRSGVTLAGLPASRDPLPDTVVVIFTCTWPRHMPQSDSVTVTLCSPTEDDWPGMFLLAAASFTDFIGPESATAWRTLVPTDGAVVVRDGAGPGSEVVGMALYMDLRLTVPGEVVLPTAGLSFVAVAPTHRRRGLLRAMCAELHRRIADSGYPVAALHASEGGIYGRFGYGPRYHLA